MAAVTVTTTDSDATKPLQEVLALPILLIDRIRSTALSSPSPKPEITETLKQVDTLSLMLSSAVRFTSSVPPQSLYDRPLRRIITELSKNLDRSLTLVRRCRHTGFFKQVLSISTSADFKKLSNLLEASIGDMKWLLGVFDCEGNNLTLPPIVSSNEPTLAMVWSSIATLMMGKQLGDRVEAVNYLCLLAESSDRNKKMIVEEGGVGPLLRMLKDGSDEGKIAAANALAALSCAREVAAKGGIGVIVQALGGSVVKVQIAVAGLVARMAEVDERAREEFGKENVMRPIVSSCLMMDLVLDDKRVASNSIHSVVDQMNKGLGKSYNKVQSSTSFSSLDGGSSRGGNRKDRESESAEVKLELKVKCATALWRLCKGSLLNSRKIAEGRGLQCLSKLIETEKGELRLYCLLTVMEIAEVAEVDSDFRKVAWKPSLAPVKAVLDQLLRVIDEESSPDFQIPPVKAIGCLARTFAAKETRILGPLVSQLGNNSASVAIEAAVALGKFVCPENYNCVEHSKAIIEFNGVSHLMKMLRANDRTRIHGLILLCYLSVNAGNNKALEEARTLEYLESSAARSVVVSNPVLRDLYFKALDHLKLYQVGARPHVHNYSMV